MKRSGIKIRIITDNETSSQLGRYKIFYKFYLFDKSDIGKFKKIGISVKMNNTSQLMHHKVFRKINSLLLLL